MYIWWFIIDLLKKVNLIKECEKLIWKMIVCCKSFTTKNRIIDISFGLIQQILIYISNEIPRMGKIACFVVQNFPDAILLTEIH